MDRDEWVLLSDDEFLEIHDDGGRTIYGSNNPIDFITNNSFESDPIPPENQIVDVQSEPTEEMGGDHDHDHADTMVVNSHVSFKKMKRENEFVDMKMDSPENGSCSSSRVGGELEDDERSDGGRRLKIWKWPGTTGIGAICSFGVAAATFCFIVFANVNGNHLKEKKKKSGGEKMDRKLPCFQIYGDDKSINQEALNRANITVGRGYSDLL